MHIIEKKNQETIRVIHNSAEEMRESIKKLMDEGWSGNTRSGFSGATLSRQTIFEEDIKYLSENFPGVVVQEPKKDSIFDVHHYVYLTEHVRDIKEEK